MNLDDHGSLKGYFLIAMPGLADPNFHLTVTYLCEHTSEGAMGLIINRVHSELSLKALFEELKIESIPEADALPVNFGGPVQPQEVFMLHGPPFGWQACRPVTPSVALSNSRDLLEAVAGGTGPQSILVALGCAGWGPGQLEAELMANAWLTSPASDIVIFDTAVEKRWEDAARRMGIDPARLVDSAGHA
jgi:putative transcriptional regulator